MVNGGAQHAARTPRAQDLDVHVQSVPIAPSVNISVDHRPARAHGPQQSTRRSFITRSVCHEQATQAGVDGQRARPRMGEARSESRPGWIEQAAAVGADLAGNVLQDLVAELRQVARPRHLANQTFEKTSRGHDLLARDVTHVDTLHYSSNSMRSIRGDIPRWPEGGIGFSAAIEYQQNM